jgi:hypothetical protein
MRPETVVNGTDSTKVTTASASAGLPSLSLNAAGVFAILGAVGLMI